MCAAVLQASAIRRTLFAVLRGARDCLMCEKTPYPETGALTADPFPCGHNLVFGIETGERVLAADGNLCDHKLACGFDAGNASEH